MSLPNEVCLLGLDWSTVCMQKGEWAGWVQAGGAMLALWTTIRLARSTVRQRTDSAKSAALIFAHRLHLAISGILEVCERYSTEQERARKAAVTDEVASFGEAISLVDLDARLLNPFLALRALAAEVRWAANTVAAPPTDYRQWEGDLKSMAKRAADLLVEMGDGGHPRR